MSHVTFIGCHNVRLQSCWMVVPRSVRALSCHDDVHACARTRFVPYQLHKFKLTPTFSYLWLLHISVLASYHFLSADYLCVRLMNLFSFFICVHAVETFFRIIFICLHVVSCPVSFCIHVVFYSFSSCLHIGINFLLV